MNRNSLPVFVVEITNSIPWFCIQNSILRICLLENYCCFAPEVPIFFAAYSPSKQAKSFNYQKSSKTQKTFEIIKKHREKNTLKHQTQKHLKTASKNIILAHYNTGWWFQPLWKICSSVGMIIPYMKWNNKIHVPNHQAGLRSSTWSLPHLTPYPRHGTCPRGDIEATDKAMAGFMAGAPASRRKAWPPDVWWDGIGMRICCSCEWVEISDQLGIYIYIYCVYIYTAYIYIYICVYLYIYVYMIYPFQLELIGI